MSNDTKPRQYLPISNDSYIARMFLSGRPAHITAAKLGMTVEEVNKRWAEIKNQATEVPANGLKELRDHQLLLLDQFALLGTSMAIVSNAINNTVSLEELKHIIAAKPPGSDLADWLMKQLIVLKPFALPSPEKMLEDHRNTVKGN